MPKVQLNICYVILEIFSHVQYAQSTLTSSIFGVQILTKQLKTVFEEKLELKWRRKKKNLPQNFGNTRKDELSYWLTSTEGNKSQRAIQR